MYDLQFNAFWHANDKHFESLSNAFHCLFIDFPNEFVFALISLVGGK
jgi:hypothetical protein